MEQDIFYKRNKSFWANVLEFISKDRCMVSLTWKEKKQKKEKKERKRDWLFFFSFRLHREGQKKLCTIEQDNRWGQWEEKEISWPQKGSFDVAGCHLAVNNLVEEIPLEALKAFNLKNVKGRFLNKCVWKEGLCPDWSWWQKKGKKTSDHAMVPRLLC